MVNPLLALYGIAFLLPGAVGWTVESIGSRSWHCDGLGFGMRNCLPLALMWSLCGVFLLTIRLLFPTANRLLLAVIAGLLISTVECVTGLASQEIGYGPPWNYQKLAGCDGFASIPVTLVWITGSFLFFSLVDWLLKKPYFSGV